MHPWLSWTSPRTVAMSLELPEEGVLPFRVEPHPTEETPLLAAPVRKNSYAGYILMLISSVFFSTMTLLIRVAEHTYSVPAPTTFLFRGIVDIIVSACYIFLRLNPRTVLSKLTARGKLLLLARGVLGSLIIVTLFSSLHHLSLGESITIFFIGPVFTLLLSHFTLGEPLSLIDLAAGAVSVAGVGMIANQPDEAETVAQGSSRTLGTGLAVSAALLSAVVFTMVRALSTKIHFTVSIFSLAVCTLGWSVLLGGVLPFAEIVRLKDGLLLAFLAAIVGNLGQLCLDKGLQNCRAGPGTLLRTVDVPASYILGLLVLHESPSWRSTCGSFFVLFATFIVGLRQVMGIRHVRSKS